MALQWHRNRWPWMTLNDHFALKSATNELACLAFGQNCSKIWRATYICSPGTLVSSKVRFVWIFAAVCWKWASNKSGVVVNGDFRFFRSLYLPNLHIHGHNYYIVLCSPLVDLHWHRNGWPWITLSGHFALKSGSSSASNCRRSGFRRKLFGNLQSYA